MIKTKNLVWIMAITIFCVLAFILYNKYNVPTKTQPNVPVFSDEFIQTNTVFSDGLSNPDSITQYQLDEFDIGIAEKSIYYIDINNDKKTDRITKTFNQTGNAHAYYEYKIELNSNGNFVDITPQNFRTINGVDCDLQQIQFIFKPQFKVIFISRNLGDVWNTPTMASKQTYRISNDKLISDTPRQMRPICDVKELF